MKKNILVFLLISITLVSLSQNINKQIFDIDYKDSLLVGLCNITAFEYESYLDWYVPEFEEYNPNDSILSILKSKSDNISIIVVFALWCSDSRREVPRFLKIIDALDFEESRLKLIAVDTKKQALDIDISAYEIKLVPTFIFYQNNKELGRIIESPETSLEEDFLKILQNY